MVTDSALDRRAWSGRSRSPAAARRRQGAPQLARSSSLLFECGAATNIVEAGWRRDCPSCHVQHFPRTDPVAIMLPVAGERCVLGRSHRFQPGMWSCLAGFVEPGEAIEDAVRREAREEAGIICGRVSYFASQPWPFPTSLMIGCHAEALSREIVIDRVELDDARWFDREEVAAMLLRTSSRWLDHAAHGGDCLSHHPCLGGGRDFL